MIPLQVHALTKIYRPAWSRKQFVAVDRLNLEVREGEIFGFLGHNGSGKTTTIKMILGLVRPTAGRALILGRDFREIDVKRSVGYLPESPYFYDYLTAEEFLKFYGRLFNMGGGELACKIDSLLEQVSLRDARSVQLRKFSKRRFGRQPDDRFSINIGFVHGVSATELESAANQSGLRVMQLNDARFTNWPHAVLSPVSLTQLQDSLPGPQGSRPPGSVLFSSP